MSEGEIFIVHDGQNNWYHHRLYLSFAFLLYNDVDANKKTSRSYISSFIRYNVIKCRNILTEYNVF